MTEPIGTDRELLVRIDERVKLAVATMEQREIYHKAEMDRMARMMADVVDGFSKTMAAMNGSYASKSDLSRLEKVVYGAVGLVLIAFMGGLVALVFRHS